MGNHDVGRGMAAAARVFWLAHGDGEVTQELALKVLDAMAEDYIGADAEFDDELLQETDLSRLLAVAFNASPKALAYLKGEDDDDETGSDDWYRNVETLFNRRYRFC